MPHQATNDRRRFGTVSRRWGTVSVDHAISATEGLPAGVETCGPVACGVAPTGQTETLTFMGPWDARPDEAVYAYNAPLGAQFMGKRVGDMVTFMVGAEERRWEVLAVESGV